MCKRICTVVLVCLAIPASAPALTLETVPVGNPGNYGEWSGESYGGYGPDRVTGGVRDAYRIGKYEVTAGQYTEFLSAVAGVDTYGLYGSLMWSSSKGCKVERYAGSGTSGDPYQYRVAPERANRPVNFVTFWDAARFANWLHNGQPTGGQDASTTEDGAYTLTAIGMSTNAITRNAGWTWAVPSEDEWYKAAYHKNDGVTTNYFDYPTSSDTMPTNTLIDPDPGNHATFFSIPPGDTIGSPYWRTEVGAHENSQSPYGTYDQGGNVWELNETIVYTANRGVRGGSYSGNGGYLSAAYRNYGSPSGGVASTGFRVVQVPEPATIALLALGGLALAGRIRRRRGSVD